MRVLACTTHKDGALAPRSCRGVAVIAKGRLFPAKPRVNLSSLEIPAFGIEAVGSIMRTHCGGFRKQAREFPHTRVRNYVERHEATIAVFPVF